MSLCLTYQACLSESAGIKVSEYLETDMLGQCSCEVFWLLWDSVFYHVVYEVYTHLGEGWVLVIVIR